jgi:hypothetical protein
MTKPALRLLEGGGATGPMGPQGLQTQAPSAGADFSSVYTNATTYFMSSDLVLGGSYLVTSGHALEERFPSRSVNAQLPVLPAPLVPIHGPLLVTIHYWRDVVVADLPICAVSGKGETDTAALEDLGAVMLDWARGVQALGEVNLGGALKRQWAAFRALVDVSAL